MEITIYLFLTGATWLFLQFKHQGKWAPGKEFMILIGSICWPAAWVIILIEAMSRKKSWE